MQLSPDSPLGDVRLVLVAPMYAGNVGAVARVAANFELADIRIVQPQCRVKSREALLYAKGPALDFLEGMREEPSLERALEGCAAAVGFTRRTQGLLRKRSLALRELFTLAGTRHAPIALVFGREDGGLSSDELAQCTHICGFDVGQTMPSLNLSHAIAVVVARLFDERVNAATKSQESRDSQVPGEANDAPATVDALGALFEHWQSAMIDAGLTTGGNPERLLGPLKRALTRASLTKREVGLFRAYLSKTQVAMGTRIRARSQSSCPEE